MKCRGRFGWEQCGYRKLQPGGIAIAWGERVTTHPLAPFFTELSLVTDFRCQNGRSWVRSATDAGPIYPAVVAHTGKSTEQRADEARDDDADSEDDATDRQHAFVQWEARQAVHLGE